MLYTKWQIFYKITTVEIIKKVIIKRDCNSSIMLQTCEQVAFVSCLKQLSDISGLSLLQHPIHFIGFPPSGIQNALIWCQMGAITK